MIENDEWMTTGFAGVTSGSGIVIKVKDGEKTKRIGYIHRSAMLDLLEGKKEWIPIKDKNDAKEFILK
jgi:hypothetical protein